VFQQAKRPTYAGVDNFMQLNRENCQNQRIFFYFAHNSGPGKYKVTFGENIDKIIIFCWRTCLELRTYYKS
jgi:hypothetical protein